MVKYRLCRFELAFPDNVPKEERSFLMKEKLEKIMNEAIEKINVSEKLEE